MPEYPGWVVVYHRPRFGDEDLLAGPFSDEAGAEWWRDNMLAEDATDAVVKEGSLRIEPKHG